MSHESVTNESWMSHEWVMSYYDIIMTWFLMLSSQYDRQWKWVMDQSQMSHVMKESWFLCFHRSTMGPACMSHKSVMNKSCHVWFTNTSCNIRFTNSSCHIMTCMTWLERFVLKRHAIALLPPAYTANVIAHCHTPSHTAMHCHTLQRTATHCNTMQLAALQLQSSCLLFDLGSLAVSIPRAAFIDHLFLMPRNTLQHTATHYSTLEHTATHCHTLSHTVTHRNTLKHAATSFPYA